MPLQSMTGFARLDGRTGRHQWAWELRSVNGKGLDLRLRLPQGFERLEPDVRRIASAHFARGNIQATLNIQAGEVRVEAVVNEAALQAVLDLRKTLEGKVDATSPRGRAVEDRGSMHAIHLPSRHWHKRFVRAPFADCMRARVASRFRSRRSSTDRRLRARSQLCGSDHHGGRRCSCRKPRRSKFPAAQTSTDRRCYCRRIRRSQMTPLRTALPCHSTRDRRCDGSMSANGLGIHLLRIARS